MHTFHTSNKAICNRSMFFTFLANGLKRLEKKYFQDYPFNYFLACKVVKNLEPLVYVVFLCLRTSASQNQAQNTKNLTQEQKNQIINECVEDHFSPADVAKKWGCNPDTIRTWIRKAGKTLPKTYKKSAFSDSGVSG